METIAVIQLATTAAVPSPGALSRTVAALLAGRLNRAPSLHASLVELRASEHHGGGGPEPLLPSESDVRERVVVNTPLETAELEEIARTFQARNWLTGRLDIDPGGHEVHIALEMAPVLAGSDSYTALVPWRSTFTGDLDEVAAVLNAAALAVAAELGGTQLTEALTAALPIETRSFEAFCHYCRALDAADPGAARAELEDACAIDPWFVEALGELARAALRAEDQLQFQEWAALLLQAGHLRPRRMIEELVQICDAGFPASALDYAMLAAQLRPEGHDLLALVAEIGLRHPGEAAMAATTLLTDRDDAKDSWHLLGLRAALHRSQGAAASADALTERALAEAASSDEPLALAECQYELGAQALRAEDLDRAVLHLKAALELDAESTLVRGDLAAALLRLGRCGEAARLLESADSHHVVLQSNLALALRQLGRFPEALEAAQRAITADANHPQAWAILGDLLRSQGRLEDAAGAFERAAAVEPENLIWRMEYGRVLFRLERFTEAVAQLRVVLGQRPELAQLSAELLFVMAELAQAQGRDSEVEDLLIRAWELDPTVWQAANNLGVRLLQQGRVDEAATWLTRALEVVPENIGVRANLERALESMPHKH